MIIRSKISLAVSLTIVSNLLFASVFAQTASGSQEIDCPAVPDLQWVEQLEYYGTSNPSDDTTPIDDLVSGFNFSPASVNFSVSNIASITHGVGDTVTPINSGEFNYFGFGVRNNPISNNLSGSGCTFELSNLNIAIQVALQGVDDPSINGLDNPTAAPPEFIQLRMDDPDSEPYTFSTTATAIYEQNSTTPTSSSGINRQESSNSDTQLFENNIARIMFRIQELSSSPSTTPLPTGTYSGTLTFSIVP